MRGEGAARAAHARRSSGSDGALQAADDAWLRARGEAARDALLQRGYSVDFRAYPMEHAVCLEEIQVIREFLVAALS